ncbi:MAG: repressor LexA [Fuerstiella sp.]|nr:repressor LexA [Fuerstiella sp.]
MKSFPKRQTLTARQREIFEFVREIIVDRGYGPTVREIASRFGIRSPNGVMGHLKALEKKGLISRESNMSRAIQICGTAASRLRVPFDGTAVSGRPIRTAVSADQFIEFGDMFDGVDRSTIKVEGPAFVPLGICEGDFLIISQHSQCGPESLVVILDDRHQVAIYRIPEDGGVPYPAISGELQSSKQRFLGVLIGVVRKLERLSAVKPKVNAVAPDVVKTDS